ncbi:MAG TPA: small multi-drug export protein [Spirochaetota bacterium]|nr:MAG: putative small multi-drug export protein [Spirochaetes bacterium ADurb.Bin133]HPY87283.1 small multi-drug export protein [Spirochaetota bacterium]
MKKTDNFILLTVVFCLLSVIMSSADVSGDGLGLRIANKFKDAGIDPYIVILLISTLPIVELRGAIPIGIIAFQLNWFLVILLSIIGNMIPIFFVLFLFKYVEKFLRRFKVFDVFFDKLFARTIAKSKSVEEFQELGLAFFVAIPLPVTGAWTGSLIAYLLKLSYLKSIFFIFLGVVCAGAIVSVITYFKMTGLIIALSVLVIITLFGALKTYLNRKKDNGKVSS